MDRAPPTIRPFAPADLPALVDLWWAVDREAHRFRRNRPRAEYLREMTETYVPMMTLLVAEAGDGRIVGFAGVLAGYIGLLHVDRRHRGHGTGRALVEAARALSPEKLWVHVFRSNAKALGFYRRCGFTVEKERVRIDPGDESVELVWRSPLLRP